VTTLPQSNAPSVVGPSDEEMSTNVAKAMERVAAKRAEAETQATTDFKMWVKSIGGIENARKFAKERGSIGMLEAMATVDRMKAAVTPSRRTSRHK
jgi:hypothetical protein